MTRDEIPGLENSKENNPDLVEGLNLTIVHNVQVQPLDLAWGCTRY